MRLAILLISLMAVSCASLPEGPRDQDTIDISMDVWREQFGHLSARCRQDRRHLQVYSLPRGELTRCGEAARGADVSACFVPNDMSIWIADDLVGMQRQEALGHEVIHMLANCTWGDPYQDHRDPALGVCLWRIDYECIYGQILASLRYE